MRTHRWAVLLRWAALLNAVLLCTGCVTLSPRQGGSTAEGPRALSTLRDTTSTELGEYAHFVDRGEQARLHRRRSARGLNLDAASASLSEVPAYEVVSAGLPPREPPSCGGQAVPLGWPDFSSSDKEALLAPFFTCTSPVEFIALQERVDMPRLVGALDEWRAVRLGTLGPVREDAAGILNRKRASFIVEATEDYGAAHAEVFVRFLADSSFDDDLREILFRLSQDKRLETTLGLMPQVCGELEARRLKLSVRPDRDFKAGDLLRGVGSALEHMAYPDRKNALYARYAAQRSQLPVPYQEDLDHVERAEAERHFSPGNVALGSFDHLTFGVPLGFYYLVVGTGQGLESLSQGKYEQATRELAPAALLVALYAGGKGVSYLKRLREDAAKPRSQRRFLGDFDRPRLETQVGVRKLDTGLRYADVLVIEEGTLGGRPRRVETFSFKSRDLSGLRRDALTAQMIEDANEALRKYGETVDIRRGSLQPHLPEGSKLQVSRVRLIYEGGHLTPKQVDSVKAVVDAVQEKVPGVEVSFQ